MSKATVVHAKTSEYDVYIGKSEKFSVQVFPIYHPSPRNLDITERRQRFERDIEILCELMKRAEKR